MHFSREDQHTEHVRIKGTSVRATHSSSERWREGLPLGPHVLASKTKNRRSYTSIKIAELFN